MSNKPRININSIRYWNSVASDLVATDYSYRANTSGAALRKAPDQPGPTATSRAQALIHLAMYNAIRVAAGQPLLLGVNAAMQTAPAIPAGINVDIAVANAAHYAAQQLYPTQIGFLNDELTCYSDVNGLPLHYPSASFGQKIAQATLMAHANDGSAQWIRNPADQIVPSDAPGQHRADPHAPAQGALHRHWGGVHSFSLPAGTYGSISAPPPLNSALYLKSYNEVLVDGREDIPLRNPLKAMIGVFWAYDGPNKLGTPPRLYNQVVAAVADLNIAGLTGNARRDDDARLFALVNVGMCDAGISAWHWKYIYNFWRPVLGIREAGDANPLASAANPNPPQIGASGPDGIGDGNSKTVGDPFWCPLGAQATNEKEFNGLNVTPGFPAYPSGHATFGTTAFYLAAAHYNKKPEQIKFDFVSDEFNGKNADAKGVIRPNIKRSFSLKTADEENRISRVYLGVHWKFDADGGHELGKDIAIKVRQLFP